ncbi:hypothetical protein BC938DRAFT_476091 [Jimgerdemannia flammicorona]|uniref:Uncharacterized protein n=1 Tax=Jimgerdemannia flammicorona TaxID=994334 RepID=A0A433PKE6_9FUNG|nr:hypothetical protein BC938DRAFT_476091 [Jimgerdemannia flammicorona]
MDDRRQIKVVAGQYAMVEQAENQRMIQIYEDGYLRQYASQQEHVHGRPVRVLGYHEVANATVAQDPGRGTSMHDGVVIAQIHPESTVNWHACPNLLIRKSSSMVAR